MKKNNLPLLHSSHEPRWYHEHLAPALIGLTCALLAGFLAWCVHYYAQTTAYLERRERTQAVLLNIREHLDNELQNILAVPETLAVFIATQGKLERNTFSAVAGRLTNTNRYIRNIALSPDNVIKYIYPLASNEQALGLHYLDIPEQRNAVQKAIATRRTVVAGPVELIQGGRGLISRTPVFRTAATTISPEKSYWGIVSLTVNADTLFAAVGLEANYDNFLVAARGMDASGKQGQVFVGSESVFQASPITQDYPLPGGGSWQLAVIPAQGWNITERTYWLLSLVAYFFAALVGFLVYRLTLSRRRMLALAMYDRLTGLANRRLFEDRLIQAIKTTRRYHAVSALVLIDLDGFKPVNDTYGHRSGDEVLSRVAQRLVNRVRECDTVARLGGDEFALILQDMSSTEYAQQVAEQVTADIGEPILLDNGQDVSIGCSIGIALFPLQNKLESIAALFDRADRALYQSKNQGRGRISQFNGGE